MYLVKQVSSVLDLPCTQIAQIGQIIQPEIPAHGRGHRSNYSFRNMVEIAIFHHMAKFGVPRKHIQRYLKDLGISQFRWLEHEGFDGWVVLDDQWRWSAGTTPDAAIENMERTAPVFAALTVDVKTIKEKIREKLGLEKVH
jgi:hypothetical protein